MRAPTQLSFSLVDRGSTFAPKRRQTNPERLPTNTTTRHHPVHRWFNFIAGFSPEFVASCIDKLPNTSHTKTLLDPFAGCATAQVESLRLGLNAIGYEAHPIFARIAQGKLTARHLLQLDEIDRVLSNGLRNPVDPSTIGNKPSQFLSKLFDPESLAQLLGARDALARSSYATDPLAFLVLSKVLECVSTSQTDGIYKAPTSKKRGKTPDTALADVIGLIHEDIIWHPLSTKCKAALYEHTSQAMPEVTSGSVDLVVTSPPYLNNFDFAEMTRMHLYFWGMAKSWGEISATVRSKLIVNTTTALHGEREKQSFYRSRLPIAMHAELDALTHVLASVRETKPGKKDYHLLVYPYFAQMQDVLVECKRALRKGGPFHMMVADAALYGIHVPAPQLLAQLLSTLGYLDVECRLVRKRGHRWVLNKRTGSSTGLGEYHVSACKP